MHRGCSEALVTVSIGVHPLFLRHTAREATLGIEVHDPRDPRQERGAASLVTGANRGIGRATLEALREEGWRALALTRSGEGSPPRGEAQLPPIDLATPESIEEGARAITASHPRISLLVNNAGTSSLVRIETAEGFERTLAVNHFGTVRLTLALLPALLAGAPSRIVVVSSAAHAGQWKPKVFEANDRFDGRAAYAQSKLANLLFAADLARRLEGSGVTVTAAHPGLVATGLLDDLVGRSALRAPIRWLLHRLARSPGRAAETLVRAAAIPVEEGAPVCYLKNGEPTEPRALVRDPSVQDRLRDWTADRIGVDWGARIDAVRLRRGDTEE